MSTGAKVVGWLENYKGRDVIFRCNGPEGAYGYAHGHKTGPHFGDPLVRQIDHLAELDAAREAGIREVLAAVVGWIYRRAEATGSAAWNSATPPRAVLSYLAGELEHYLKEEDPMRYLLPTPPTPDNEQEG